MKEVIIYAPSLNSTEFLRSLASNGLKTINYKIFDTPKLAKYILTKNGISFNKKIISIDDQTNIIASLYKNIPYFTNCSYLDCSNISTTISNLRCEVKTNDDQIIKYINKSQFKDKNEALINLYNAYLEKLDALNVSDRIGLINEALSYKVDSDIYILEEEHYSVKEECLYSCFKNVNKVNLCFLYNKEKSSKININNYYQCYGVNNEIENIINYIYSSNLLLDKCLIAYTSTDYIKNLYDYFLEYNIPFTLGDGLKVFDTSPGKLLNALYLHQLNGAGNKAKDSLVNLINSSYFNKELLYKDLFEDDEENIFNQVIELFGKLRLGFDRENDLDKLNKVKNYCNEYLFNKLNKLLTIFSKGIFELACIYSKDRIGLVAFDNAARIKIKDSIISFDTYLKCDKSTYLDELVKKVLNMMCNIQSSLMGSIHVCSIDKALSVQRENLFIVGLDSSFPGNPKENYLVLDDELKLINPLTNNDSFSLLNNKKELLYNVLKINTLLNNNINLSYSDYNLIDIKEVNKSSMLFDIYRYINGDKVTFDDFNKTFIKVPYFSSSLSINDCIGKAFILDKKITHQEKSDNVVLNVNLLDRVFTPTQIEKYFVCPFKFYLNYILGIDEPIIDNPYEAISSIDLGNVAHELLETFEKDKETLDQFKTRCIDKINEILSIRPPMFEHMKKKTISDFLDMMTNAYNMDYGNKIEKVEVFTDIININGIKMSGKFDRLEKDDKGRYYLVDYKTKNKVEHVENDALTCLQLAIYTKLLEVGKKLHYKIEDAEYRYLKLEKTVKFKFNDENKVQFSSLMDDLYNSLKEVNFTKCLDNDKCRYCSMKLMCNLIDDGGEDFD